MKNIIDRIKDLNLSNYPIYELKSILNEIGKVQFMEVKIGAGKEIIRARKNENNEVSFSNKHDLSIKPANLNTKYQRASSPYKSMFYGSSLANNLTENGISIAREIAFSETCDEIIKKDTVTGKITFGKWIVKDNNQLNLFPIFGNTSNFNVNSYLKEIYDDHKIILSKIDPQVAENSSMLLYFLSNEYSKELNYYRLKADRFGFV